MSFSLVVVSGFFEIAHHDTQLILVAVFTSVFFVFFYSISARPIPLCVRGILILLFTLRSWNPYTRRHHARKTGRVQLWEIWNEDNTFKSKAKSKQNKTTKAVQNLRLRIDC
jgi:hypothetical protein